MEQLNITDTITTTPFELEPINNIDKSTNINFFKIIRYILIILIIIFIVLSITDKWNDVIYYYKKTINHYKDYKIIEVLHKYLNMKYIPTKKDDFDDKYDNMKYTDTDTDTKKNDFDNKYENITGYCFVGEDKGIRTCMEINVTDKCMSGNIFPNKSVCVNPNLSNNFIK